MTNAIAIANLMKRKIDLTIPLSVIIMTIIVYILGLFDNLDMGVKIVELVSIISTIYNIIYFIISIKNKNIKEDIKRIVTPRYISIYIFLPCIYYSKYRKNV